MFCSKCGTKLSEDVQICPKCGAQNENYVAPKEKLVGLKKIKFLNSSNLADKVKNAINSKRIKVGIGAIACTAVLAVGVSVGSQFIGKDIEVYGKVEYSPQGLTPYLDKDKNVHFFNGIDVITLAGSAVDAIMTPDHSRIFVKLENNQLLLFEDKSTDGTVIAENVITVYPCSNKACFYTVGNREHLYLYDFGKRESVDIGFENSSLYFSKGRCAVAAINKKGELSCFSQQDNTPKTLCNIGNDGEICCVADDGSNVVWSSKNGNIYSVYMMKDGAPERIGKITNSEKYSSVSGYYFNNDKAFVIVSANSSQIILFADGNVNEITLPGVKTYSPMVNGNGDVVDSDDDSIEDFYFSVRKNKSTFECELYKLSQDGKLSLEAEHIIAEEYSSKHVIKGQKIYYIDVDKDLYWKALGEEGVGKKVTTDVDDLFVSASGKYIYIVKLGGLYYCDVSDKSFKLNLITSSFSENDRLFLTDKDDQILYISDLKEVMNSYRERGTLYQFQIGTSPKAITLSVLDVIYNDEKYINAVSPLIRKYVSNISYNYIVDYGTIKDGAYETLISDIEY